MKIKLAAYATAAVLIGFAVMMLPLALETGPPTYDPRQAPSTYISPLSEGGNEQRNQQDGTLGPASAPYNILPSGLILLAGLAVALIGYASLRKQLK
jgi:hypothetical protein